MWDVRKGGEDGVVHGTGHPEGELFNAGTTCQKGDDGASLSRVTDTGGANEGAKVEVSNVPSIRGGHGGQEAADGIVGSEAHGLRKENQKKEDRGR